MLSAPELPEPGSFAKRSPEVAPRLAKGGNVERQDRSNHRDMTAELALALSDELVGRGQGFVATDEPLGPGAQGVHDAACDIFALAASSIGEHVGKESLVPWTLVLRLSAQMIKLAEIVALAEEEIRALQGERTMEEVGS